MLKRYILSIVMLFIMAGILYAGNKLIIDVYSDDDFGFDRQVKQYVTKPIVEAAKKEGYKPDGTPLTHWEVGEWTPVIDENSCGVIHQTRTVKCVDNNGNVYNDNECEGEKPIVEQDVDTGKACGVLGSIEIKGFDTAYTHVYSSKDVTVYTLNSNLDTLEIFRSTNYSLTNYSSYTKIWNYSMTKPSKYIVVLIKSTSCCPGRAYSIDYTVIFRKDSGGSVSVSGQTHRGDWWSVFMKDYVYCIDAMEGKVIKQFIFDGGNHTDSYLMNYCLNEFSKLQ